MKKNILAGAVITAAVGLSGVAVAPAATADVPFANCSEVFAAGIYNITPDHPRWADKLDRSVPRDNVGCEVPPNGAVGLVDYAGQVSTPAPAPAPAPSTGYNDPTDQALPDAAYTYPDCADAFAVGVYNIPESSADYHDDLDSDDDGIACEFHPATGTVIEGREAVARQEIAMKMAAVEAESDDAEQQQEAAEPQVEVIPEGGADTGMPMPVKQQDYTGLLVAGGALIAAAGVGGVAAARRRA